MASSKEQLLQSAEKFLAKGKLENLNLGEGDGSRMFTLPNKIRFIGVSKPDMVSAGALSVCE